jgi:hypothetical protein
MKTGKLCAAGVLLFVSAIPVFGRSDAKGPRSWFHRDHTPRGPAASYHRGNQHVANHHSSKHPKPGHHQNAHH